MRTWIRFLATFVCLTLALPAMAPASPTASRTTSIAGDAALDDALDARVAEDDAAREHVRDVLLNPEVRALVEALGYDVTRAESAVDALDGDELAAVQDAAAGLDASLAGGAETVSISLVSLLLIVLIVVLLA